MTQSCLRFSSRSMPGDEHAVVAVDPCQGNDTALLAVFNNPYSPAELAAFLNAQYDAYLRVAVMTSARD